jgi:hypothetical protein
MEEVAYVETHELAAIEGLDEEIAAELQNRAQEALDRREVANREERQALGVEDGLAELPHLTEAMLVTLGKAGIKTLDDLADLLRQQLHQTATDLPLVKILQGGTWAAGRTIAAEKRLHGGPPITLASDGTVF